MRTACELMSTLALPSIRARIAKVAIEKYGMRQKDVALRLGLTRAAVSQYMKEKRAGPTISETHLKSIEDMIDNASMGLAKGELSEFDLTRAFCRMCAALRHSQALCAIHKAREPKLVGKNCLICGDMNHRQSDFEIVL
ncbi:MAG TPA: helix-turn-helix domain-containing protein [Candidatus Bathyarchaeia archaeon]|nr:helix-turn-helix domain-containing protein [Candidatus Bathyarchaeia archaeon]